MRHTPGPWHGSTCGGAVYSETGEWICETGEWICHGDTRNLPLIAAAPELYDAVRDAKKVLGDLLHAGEVSGAALLCADRLTALLARLEEI